MSTDHFVDTAPLLYAVGGPHPHRAACHALVARATDGEFTLHVSTEAVQEYVHHRLRIGGRAQAVSQSRDLMDLCTVHDVTVPTLRRVLDLVELTHLRGRDAVHVATALEAGFTSIVSTDVDLDHVP
ncbi:MAG: type II toxin-antitoxin system VapC family toxin, partial [Phycicoccus sp.]